MVVVCVRFPFYAATVERREDDALRKQPLILAQNQVEAVYSMSHEAANEGVQLDVPLRQARLICPEAAFRPSALTYYEQTAHQLARWMLDFTDQVEPQPTRPALTYYMDGTFSAEKHTIPYAQEIGRTLRQESALTPAIGIAANKFAAYLAAKCVDAGRMLPVSAEHTTPFLSKIPLYWLSLPAPLRDRCNLLGIRTLGAFANLPTQHLRQQFGHDGHTLYQLAHGIDPRPVRRYPLEQQTLWEHAFDDPLCNALSVQHVMWEGAQQLVTTLQQRNLSARGVTLKLALDNGETMTTREQFSQPTQAFRHLQRTLQQLLNRNVPAAGVLHVQIALSYLAPIVQRQLSLFDAPTLDETLTETIAHLADLYGQRFFQIDPFRPNSRFPERRYRVRTHAALLG